MANLLRLVACLFLCVSLNSFGALFGMNYYGIQAMDFDTENWSQVSGGPTTGQGHAGSLAFGNNTLFAMNYYGIQAMDFDTGNWSQVSGGPTTGQGHAGDLAAVPLPAGIYLFLSGLVGLGLMRGRNG
jgi:hypothetical protein